MKNSLFVKYVYEMCTTHERFIFVIFFMAMAEQKTQFCCVQMRKHTHALT